MRAGVTVVAAGHRPQTPRSAPGGAHGATIGPTAPLGVPIGVSGASPGPDAQVINMLTLLIYNKLGEMAGCLPHQATPGGNRLELKPLFMV